MKDTLLQALAVPALAAIFLAIPLTSQAFTFPHLTSLTLPSAQSRSSISLIVTSESGTFLHAKGTLTDAAGKPIPNAALILTFDGIEVARPTTDADGNWNQPLDSDGQDPSGLNKFRISYVGDANHAPSAISGSLNGGLVTADANTPKASYIEASLVTNEVLSGSIVTIQGHIKTDVPLTEQLVTVTLDSDKTPIGNALSGPDGSFSISVGAPNVTEPRPLTIHVTFAGSDGISGTDTVLSASLKPTPSKPSPTPSPTPKPTATPTISATPNSSPAPVIADSKGVYIPLPYLIGLGATVVVAVGVAVAAFFSRGHR